MLDAVSCAVAIQKAMVQANENDTETPMHLRIGINVGDVMVKDGDIFGDGVNIAARLESLADGEGNNSPHRAGPTSANSTVARHTPFLLLSILRASRYLASSSTNGSVQCQDLTLMS